MCICCILAGGSTRFPFILLSVRDELMARPTSSVKVHPVSTTTCCLDESLPAHKRGSWLALNPKCGTFSVLTNSTQQGRQEPGKNDVPSRGLLVLAACETATGRLSEPLTAHPVSWTTTAPPPAPAGEQPQPLPKNIFASEELVNRLAGFNLISGCLVPGKIDIRYTTNLYSHCFDKALFNETSISSSAKEGAAAAWSLSNTFLDNDKEPRLAFLKSLALAARNKFEKEHAATGGGSAEQLADALGAVLMARPNFSDADLPIEHLNLSETDKKNPVDVEMERLCQRSIVSYGQWFEYPAAAAPAVAMAAAASLPCCAGSNQAADDKSKQIAASSKAEEKNKTQGKKEEGADDNDESDSAFGEQRQDSQMDIERFKDGASPALAPVRAGTKLEWGTRMHTLIFAEADATGKGMTVHYFDRQIEVIVDEQSPRVGVASQPLHDFKAHPWTHLQWRHEGTD